MSLSDKLNTLLTAKTNIKTALTNKGLDMSSTPFTEYYNTINNLSTLKLSIGDYFVDPNKGSNSNTGTSIDAPFETINKALSNASTHQTIILLSGIYKGTSNCNLSVGNVNLIGMNGTILDGENTRRSGFTGSSTTVIFGITFQNGSTTEHGSACKLTGDAQIVDCIFKNNATTDTWEGGALHLNSYTAWVSDCTFLNNTASNTNVGRSLGLNNNGQSIYRCDFIDSGKGYTIKSFNGCNAYNCYFGTGTSLPSEVTNNNPKSSPNHPERITT